MALTKDFRERIQARARRDPAFRRALLREAIDAMLSGDFRTGNAVLRNYINATAGFAGLGKAARKSPKSLMRMFGPGGNPRARNIFTVLDCLQKAEGVSFKLTEGPASRPSRARTRFSAGDETQAYRRNRSTRRSR